MGLIWEITVDKILVPLFTNGHQMARSKNAITDGGSATTHSLTKAISGKPALLEQIAVLKTPSLM